MQTLVQMTRTVPFSLSPSSNPPSSLLRLEVSIRMNEGTVRDVRGDVAPLGLLLREARKISGVAQVRTLFALEQ